MISNDILKPLSSWVDGTSPIPARFYTPGHVDIPKSDWCVWLSIQEVKPLHLATEMEWIGLKEARKNTTSYLESASEIIDGLEGGWLDNEERMWILDELGEPPNPSLPIYLISYINEMGIEQLVYVGKTKNTSRFDGGHSAALKLHNPKYDGKEKKIYRSTVWFHYDDEYISLDWIQPESLALELLDSVESHLIYSFQPELNIYKKNKPTAKWNFYIHIQNFLAGGFLNDTFV